MADRYWVGGSGTWDASDTSHWSTSSGGASGASVPTSSDNVIFNNNSGASPTVTTSGTLNCLDITTTAPTSGNLTFTGSAQLNIYGNLSFYSGMSANTNMVFNMAATSGTKTIQTNGTVLGREFFINGSGGTFQLLGNLELGATSSVFANYVGTFDPNGFGVILSGPGLNRINAVIPITFYNLTRTGTAAKVDQLDLTGNITVTNTLTLTGNSSNNRLLVLSNVKGSARTITAATVTVTNTDFQDIVGAGAGSWNLSAISGGSGDCGGNSGITFTTQQTNYWIGGTGNWDDVNEWASSSGGGAGTGRVPLPQDTARFDANSFSSGSLTVTQNMTRIGTVNWTGVTNTPAWAMSTVASFFGSITLVAGMTIANTPTYTYEGRGSSVLTSAGKTWVKTINVDAVTGTLTLGDAFTTTDSLIITSGNFNAGNYDVSLGAFASNFTSTRSLTMGSGTWSLTATGGTLWNIATATGMTLTCGTSTIKYTGALASAVAFVSGNGLVYYNLWNATTNAFDLNMQGNVSFNQIRLNAGRSIKFTAGSTTTFNHLYAIGTRTSNITIGSITASAHTLTHTGTGPVEVRYCSISYSTASGAQMVAHVSTDGGNNTVWSFAAARYWVGGTGNWSDTGHWSTSSGGASGAAIPTATEDAVFDDQSHTTDYTVTTNNSTTSSCFDLIFQAPSSGNLTFTGAAGYNLEVWGSIYKYSTMVDTFRNYLYMRATSGVRVIFSAGVAWTCTIGCNGTGGTFQLQDDLTINGTNVNGISMINQQNGTFDMNGKTVTLTGSGSVQSFILAGTLGTITFYNLTFAPSSSTFAYCEVTGNITVTNNLVANGFGPAERFHIWSSVRGTARTITAASISCSNLDLRDITGAGAGSWNLSAITGGSGDMGGNSGITFTTAQTNYWEHGASASYPWNTVGNWFLATNGAGGAGRVPLPQDDAVFDSNSFAASGRTVTSGYPFYCKNITWTGVTNSPTWSFTGSALGVQQVFGSITLDANMTLTTSTSIYFEGRGSHTITSAGKSFAAPITFWCPGGTYTLQDAYVGLNISAIYQSNFNTNNVSLSTTNCDFSQLNGGATVTLGSSVWTITTPNSPWFFAAPASATLNAGTSTIQLLGTLTVNRLFGGGGQTYNNLIIGTTGAYNEQITGSNTFNNIHIDASAAARTLLFTAGTTQTVTTFTRDSGSRTITLGSTTAAQHFLAKSGAGIITLPYMSISRSTVTPSGSTWRAPASTDGGFNSGWDFGVPGPQGVL